MKSVLVWKMVGVVVLVLAVVASLRFLDRIPLQRLASAVGMTLTVSDMRTPTPAPTSSPQSLSSQVPALSLGTVAVQTFSGAVLTRTGSGVAVSSDGLILTTASVAPYGSGSSVYQVATADGRLLRARSVARDASGLVLLKVQGTDLNAVFFDSSATLTAGSQLGLVAASMRLSQYVPVIVPATVPYVGQVRELPLSADPAFAALLKGARAVDAQGRSVGLVQVMGSRFTLIPTATINAFVEKYLALDATR